MAGGKTVKGNPAGARAFEQCPEFDKVIAQHTRVGGAPGQILAGKILEHHVGILSGQVDGVVRDAQPFAFALSFINIMCLARAITTTFQ